MSRNVASIQTFGRATVALLRLNDPQRVTLRTHLLAHGEYPFAD